MYSVLGDLSLRSGIQGLEEAGANTQKTNHGQRESAFNNMSWFPVPTWVRGMSEVFTEELKPERRWWVLVSVHLKTGFRPRLANVSRKRPEICETLQARRSLS